MNLFERLGLLKHRDASAKSHIKNLIEVAEADGHFAHVEKELLKSIAKRNGFNEKQISEIHKNLEEIKLVIPEDSKSRFHRFYDLIHMMSIDNEIHDEELKLCSQLALRFGYHRDNVEDLIKSILSCIEYGRDADDTMGRVIRLIA
ncbi:MAG: TerB family tellurite resistance protein [Cytophagales bacterium]|jgi:uncharacterized tellurite resistance protein B-like protein|nr:TerB family tellurite resistance protein [Cytophagales bacterium]MCA6365694.1 TerB family tellurite resistance protein [Cytophagales bacterium]MCA6370382.1 TerB family tellurite resistance protein [Cytophagales bacterium]MCA6375630.1 TerB family tellurite resistance protein [Cytophagales bacterium]MCA6385204.1 TerB family tellurite resistance protein [Cytophagales bacterium]